MNAEVALLPGLRVTVIRDGDRSHVGITCRGREHPGFPFREVAPPAAAFAAAAILELRTRCPIEVRHLDELFLGGAA